MKSLGKPMKQEKLAAMIAEVDADGGGRCHRVSMTVLFVSIGHRRTK